VAWQGRFLTFLRDNYPMMNMTGLDLSPFYLQVIISANCRSARTASRSLRPFPVHAGS
jgi:hypothetical protein